MNFLTRLFDLIFNKDRSASPTIAESVDNKPTEQPNSGPGPATEVQRASAPPSDTVAAFQASAPPLDSTPVEPDPAGIDGALVSGTVQEEVPSRSEPQLQSTAPDFEQHAPPGASASEPANNAAEVSDRIGKSAPPQTPEPLQKSEPINKPEPIETRKASKKPEPATKTKSTANPATAEIADPSVKPEPTTKASSRSAEISNSGDNTQTHAATQTEMASADKHDIDAMINGCEMELKKKRAREDIPAPYFFERTAILSRKEKNYQQEIDYCERYIKMTEAFYKKHGTDGLTDIREGAKHRAIVERLPKARALLEKQQAKNV